MPSPGLQPPCTRRSSPESRLLTTRTTEWLKRRGGNTPDQLDTSTRSPSRSERGGPEKATPHPHASDKAELGGRNPGWEEQEEDTETQGDWEAEASLPAIGWSRSRSCLVKGRSCRSTGPRPPGHPQRCGLPAARRGLTAP